MVCMTQRLPYTDVWPLHPILPMRHRTEVESGMPKLGVMVDGSQFRIEGWETIVYHAMIGDFKTIRELVEKEKFTYRSQDELLQSWMVD